MYDFTWKSLFKLWVVVLVVNMPLMAVPEHLVEKNGMVGAVFIVSLGAFAEAAFLYGAFAPFIAAYKEAYRPERQRGAPLWYCIACGLAGMLGLLLALIPVALFMVIIGLFFHGLDAMTKGTSIFAGIALVVTVFFNILFGISFWGGIWQGIKWRINANKLKTINLSDSRKVMLR